MSQSIHPAVLAEEVPIRSKPSNYPAEFARGMQGRSKRRLGDHFGLRNFGVNLTTLSPGAITALRHAHTEQDEFVYVVSGNPTLINDDGEFALAPGMCAGFAAGSQNAHQIVNRTDQPVTLLEIGDRSPNDQAYYPDDDLAARFDPNTGWRFLHKDGTPFAPGNP